MTTKAKDKWYKVLERGKSFHGGTLKWSLPTKEGPGEWHEVSGDLVRCENGLHLTTDPLTLRPKTSPKTVRCYEAEFVGDTLPLKEHELVVRRCRLVREVPWSELAPSAALVLLSHVWKAEGAAHGGHSWRRLNDAMRTALFLAIDAGMTFDDSDFRKIAHKFNSGYWLDIEYAYKHACGEQQGGNHGPNPTAIHAIESHLGRTPFLIAREPNHGSPKDRICVGSRFSWHIDMKNRVYVTVTSFAADQSHVVACSYKEREPGRNERKVDRMFRITHDDLAAYHAAIRAHAREHAAAASANGDDS